MADKVTIPKEVAGAIEELRTNVESDIDLIASISERKIAPQIKISNWLNVNDWAERESLLLSALVNGYEVEKTPEDRVRELYDEQVALEKETQGRDESYHFGKQRGIIATLRLLDMKIEGVNDK